MKLQVEVPIGGQNHKIELTRAADPVDGKTVWTTQCRLPCTGHFGMSASAADQDTRDAVVHDQKPKVGRQGQQVIIEGIASSTSIDWHGTEMSIEALQSMAQQFKSGVPYVPSHRDDEWDQVFGKTIDAEIEEDVVLNDYNSRGVGEGAVLKVKTALIADDPNTKRLVRMMSFGNAVGMSIGGWFTDMEVVTNDEDEVERMIIKGVELDHLATTRRPSNPDTWIQEISRSIQSINKVDEGAELERMKKIYMAEEDFEPHFMYNPEDGEKVYVESYEEHLRLADLGWVHDDSEQVSELEDENDQEPVDEKGGGYKKNEKDGEKFMHVTALSRAATEYKNLALAPADQQYNPDDQDDAAMGDNILGILHGGQPDWERYRAAHLFFDPEHAEEKEGYRFPIARMYDPDAPDDVLAEDGRLHVFLDKLKMVSQELIDGVDGIDDEDLAEMVSHLQKYFEKFEEEAPELGDLVSEGGDTDEDKGYKKEDEKMMPKKYFSSDAPLSTREVVPFQDLPIQTPEDAPWSFQTDEQNEVLGDDDWDRFKRAHTWWDPERADQREGYKLPIAKLVNGELKVFWRGVTAAMAIINGARGGAKISEADRKGIYNHLVRYYKKQGKQAPSYKSLPENESLDSTSLDTSGVTGEQSNYGENAHRSAPEYNPVNSNPNESKGSAMSEVSKTEANVPDTTSTEDTVKSLSRSVSVMEGLLTKLVERDLARSESQSQESTVEQKEAAPVESEAEIALRAKVEALEARITSMSATRSGTAIGARAGTYVEPHRYGQLVRTVQDEHGGGSALALVAADQEARRKSRMEETPSRRSLETDLHSLLNAAVADGIITDPDLDGGWR